jgi:hypothetical protein
MASANGHTGTFTPCLSPTQHVQWLTLLILPN